MSRKDTAMNDEWQNSPEYNAPQSYYYPAPMYGPPLPAPTPPARSALRKISFVLVFLCLGLVGGLGLVGVLRVTDPPRTSFGLAPVSPAQNGPATATSVREWAANSTVSRDTNALVQALSDFDATTADPVSMMGQCRVLATAAANLHGDLPTPDAQLTRLLDQATSAYIRAGNACAAADWDTAAAAVDTATGYIEQATARVNELSGD